MLIAADTNQRPPSTLASIVQASPAEGACTDESGDPRNTGPNRPTSPVRSAHIARPTETDDEGCTLVAGRTFPNRDTKIKSKIGTIGTRINGQPLMVTHGRFVSVFISRFDPSVVYNDLIALVKDVHELDAKCDRLETRHDSYKLDVKCSDVSSFYNSDNWTQGAYVRRCLT